MCWCSSIGHKESAQGILKHGCTDSISHWLVLKYSKATSVHYAFTSEFWITVCLHQELLNKWRQNVIEISLKLTF